MNKSKYDKADDSLLISQKMRLMPRRDGDLPMNVPLYVAEREPWVFASRALCRAHVTSLVLVSLSKVHHSHDTPGPEREALLPRADVRCGEIHAHRVHSHRGAGLSALRPDLPQAPVSRPGARAQGGAVSSTGIKSFL